MYEAFIYQLYNITMTSLPIMWYACFDFEFFKAKEDDDRTDDEQKGALYFMDHPLLFKKSMEGAYFGVFKFASFLLYSMFHAAILLGGTYICCSSMFISQVDGKDIGLWINGHTVYGACILLANFRLFNYFNNWSGWGEALIYLMILAYFTFMFLESLFFTFYELYYVFDTMFGQPIIWINLLMVPMIPITIELIFFSFKKNFMLDENQRSHEEMKDYKALLEVEAKAALQRERELSMKQQ